MARPKKVIIEKEKVLDSDGNVVTEDIREIPVDESPEEISYEEDLAKLEQEKAEFAKAKAEFESLKKQLEVKSLDEYLKDPTFGTTMYVIVNRSVSKDVNGKPVYTSAELSCFPDALHPFDRDEKGNLKLLAPDRGFNNRAEADDWRTGAKSKTPYVYEGEEITVGEAIKRMQQKYYEKRIATDREFAKRPTIAVEN